MFVLFLIYSTLKLKKFLHYALLTGDGDRDHSIFFNFGLEYPAPGFEILCWYALNLPITIVFTNSCMRLHLVNTRLRLVN